MSAATNENGRIQKRAATPSDSLVSMIERLKPEIGRALPKHVTPDRLARIATTAIRMNPELGQTTQASFLGCIMQMSQLGLEPNTPLGQAYLIPRRSKKLGTIECTMIVGYQGWLDLVRRSGLVRGIWAHAVYEGDRFEQTLGTTPRLVHEPSATATRNARTLTHVYACAMIAGDDSPAFIVLRRDEVEQARMRGASGSGARTPWDTDYEAMAIKTAVRRLVKWLPKSVELARADVIDDAGRASLAVSDEVRDVLTSAGLVGDQDFIDADGEVIDEPVLSTTVEPKA